MKKIKHPTTLSTLAVKNLEKFLTEHPIDIRSFNFFDQGAFQQLKLSSRNAEELDNLKALQRIERLGYQQDVTCP